MFRERVPFELAIKGDKLLGTRWKQLTKPQQVVLKAFYGLPLGEEELVYWSMLQGGATFDDLGYTTGVTMVPYEPFEYSTLIAVLGRRSGKTDYIVSTGAAYETTLGGHAQYVKEGQKFKALFLAQTEADAQTNMQFIRMVLDESDLLRKELEPKTVVSEIRFKSGLVVEPAPANKAIGRGHAIPVLIADESAFWYTDAKAANPDFEVLRAINYAQLQFPYAKRFIPSTPWAEQGVLWQGYNAGTKGRKLKCEACKRSGKFLCEHPLDQRAKYSNTLVVQATTAQMESLEAIFKDKILARKRLIEIRAEDPEAFPRESLAQFIKSASGWLNKQKITSAIDVGVYEREPVTPQMALQKGLLVPSYVAAMDPAFRKDSFAFTIGHHDPQKGIVQDFIRYWEPQPGVPLKPGDILDEIKLILQSYGLSQVYSDQYQLEALQQLALDRNFNINGFDFTGTSKAKITGSFKVVIDQERVKLLDHELQKDQLENLQREVLQGGNVRIAAPPGKHDDLAMVLILMARLVMWLQSAEPEKPQPPKSVENDHVKMGLDQIERRRREAMVDEDY